MASPYLTEKDAARYLSLTAAQFRQAVLDHRIPYLQFSPRVRRFERAVLARVKRRVVKAVENR